MNISTVSNTVRTFPKIDKNTNNKAENNKVSFKGIFVDYSVDLGRNKEDSYPARFQPKDALLLNEISQEYPNQDCFIKKGYGCKPCLEFRERPPIVQCFEETLANQYKINVSSSDSLYPPVPLLIHPDDDSNFLIGVPSSISTNPSLPTTIRAGFEVHKKMLERKYQLLDLIGRTDVVDLGGKSIAQRAYESIKEIETAVKRFLIESAYIALTDRASGRQIYESDIPKIQSRLDMKRRYDLTTSVAKQAIPPRRQEDRTDICELSIQQFPNHAENEDAIEKLTSYMREKGITLENCEDIF